MSKEASSKEASNKDVSNKDASNKEDEHKTLKEEEEDEEEAEEEVTELGGGHEGSFGGGEGEEWVEMTLSPSKNKVCYLNADGNECDPWLFSSSVSVHTAFGNSAFSNEKEW